MENVVLRPLFHRGSEVIAIEAPKVRALDLAIRKLKGVRWTQTHKAWYLPLSRENYQTIADALKPLTVIDNTRLKNYLEKRKRVAATQPGNAKNTHSVTGKSAAAVWKLSPDNLAALKRLMEHLTLKAYSVSTVCTYRNEFLQLLQLLKKKPVSELTPDDLRRYFVYCFEKLHLTENTLHSRINAIKFYFEQVLAREKFFWEIPRPKKRFQLPRFFNQTEIASIIKSAGSLKTKPC